MRLTFKMEGGLAAFPGLSQPVTIDTESLPPEERASVERLVESCHFFDQPTSPSQSAGADRRRYTLAIEEDGRSHAVSVLDPVPDEVRPLFERAQSLARAARRGSKQP